MAIISYDYDSFIFLILVAMLITIFIFDIDYFKSINDTLGHLVGDCILKDISKLLKNNLRKTDIIGRWGGEEFLIILPFTSKDIAKKFVKKNNLDLIVRAHQLVQ